jgi:MFS family permease
MVYFVQHETQLQPRRGLSALLVAQFMGAANDNILKTLLGFAVVRGMWAGKLGEGGQGLIALCLFVPFIIFSGWAGPIADRYSKRSISVLMKWVEIPLAIAAGIGFVTGNFWLAAISMLLLATQSTFFSPAKYGMIPEIVQTGNVSKANGILNMTTNISIITGMLIAGVVSDTLQQDSSSLVSPSLIDKWIPGIVLTTVAVIGLLAIVWLPKLPAMDPKMHVPTNPIATYISTGKEMCKSSLMLIAIAWAFFYLLATTVLLLVTELGTLLQVSDTKVSYLLASIGISVGIGSLLAGFLSRGNIQIGLSKFAAIGMAASMAVAGLAPVSYFIILTCLIFLGLFAGLYAVPLQSLMQLMPKPDHRGRVLATSNAISFLFMAVGSLGYWVFRPLFNGSPQYIFLICAVVGIFALFIVRQIRLSSLPSKDYNKPYARP